MLNLDSLYTGYVDDAGVCHSVYLAEYQECPGGEYTTAPMSFLREPSGWETIHAGDTIEVAYRLFAFIHRVEGHNRSEIA